MKRIIVLISTLICLAPLFIGCTQDKEQQVLYLLGEWDTLQTARRADGDCTVGEFAITWNWLGCELRYRDLAGEHKKQLTVGQKKKIEMVAQPMNLVFEGYLTYEGNGFPAAWKERFADNDRKEKEKAAYGTLEEYAASRDGEKELEMVRAAFAQAGLKQSAEIWYQEFINVIWLHGDLSIGMVNVRIQQHDYTDDKDLIEMMITDQEGNIMSLWGFENDYIDIVMYKGEVYAGPYTG